MTALRYFPGPRANGHPMPLIGPDPAEQRALDELRRRRAASREITPPQQPQRLTYGDCLILLALCLALPFLRVIEWRRRG